MALKAQLLLAVRGPPSEGGTGLCRDLEGRSALALSLRCGWHPRPSRARPSWT